jgi:hypothetical protein
MFTGPQIVKKDGNLGSAAADVEKVYGILFGGVAASTGTYTTLGVTVLLTAAADADALGLTAAYDATNHVLVRYHIEEHFERAPGSKLYIMVVAQTVTQPQMWDIANAQYVKKLMSDSGNTLRKIGTVRNPASGYTPVFTGTQIVEDEVLATVPKAKAMLAYFAGLNIFIDVALIEGRGNPTPQATFTDLRTLTADGVVIVNTQDPGIAVLHALYATHAAVGTAMGMWGARRTEEDLGAVVIADNPDKTVEAFAIDASSDVTGKWKDVALSTGELTSSLSPTKVAALIAQGYLFADRYPQYTGIFFCAAASCTLISSDFAYVVNNCVWNYGARIVVQRLTPKFNAKVPFNTDGSGTIKASFIAAWQEDVNHPQKGLGLMVAKEIATDTSCIIDPAQDVRTAAKLVVKAGIQPYGYPRMIEGDIAFQK